MKIPIKISFKFNLPFLGFHSCRIIGAFLIPYFFSMLVCGIPLFFLEVSVGQYIGKGGMSVVGQLAPIFKGVGYSAIMMVFLENVYYIIVVTWTLFYLFNSFVDFPNLPWSDCSKGGESPCSPVTQFGYLERLLSLFFLLLSVYFDWSILKYGIHRGLVGQWEMLESRGQAPLQWVAAPLDEHLLGRHRESGGAVLEVSNDGGSGNFHVKQSSGEINN